MSVPPIELRDLVSLEDCRAAVRVQEAVWGRDGETVPASVLLVSVKRGGILIGGYGAGGLQPAENALIGFVWSMPGVRDGAPVQWSHMLGVLPEFRGARVAERLKVAQRDRALAAGVDLIEWTFDPLQAANAHLNLHVLGAVGASYGVDVYGALSGPLHRGTPTDRLIVEWWIRDRHAGRAGAVDAPAALRTVVDGGWVRCAGGMTALTSRRVLVPIPPRFLEMQQQATDLALEWRLAVREVMTAAFADGYLAVDFSLNRVQGGGAYVLARA